MIVNRNKRKKYNLLALSILFILINHSYSSAAYPETFVISDEMKRKRMQGKSNSQDGSFLFLQQIRLLLS